MHSRLILTFCHFCPSDWPWIARTLASFAAIEPQLKGPLLRGFFWASVVKSGLMAFYHAAIATPSFGSQGRMVAPRGRMGSDPINAGGSTPMATALDSG